MIIDAREVDQEWTGWMAADAATMEYQEFGKIMPVPPYIEVRVMSIAGLYPTIEQARSFNWSPIFGVYGIEFYKVRLH